VLGSESEGRAKEGVEHVGRLCEGVVVVGRFGEHMSGGDEGERDFGSAGECEHGGCYDSARDHIGDLIVRARWLCRFLVTSFDTLLSFGDAEKYKKT